MKWGICWEANKKHAQAEHSTSMTFRSTSLGTDPHMPADLLKSFSCIFCWEMLSWHLSCRPGQSSNSSVPAVAEPYELLSVCSPHVNHWALNTPYNQGHRDLEGRRPLWSGCYLTSISLFFCFWLLHRIPNTLFRGFLFLTHLNPHHYCKFTQV